MASPQTAHGYTKVANSLMRALSRFPFSGQELRLVVWVIRDSYGWRQKYTHPAPLSRVEDETGIKPSTASWAIRKLVAAGVLERGKGRTLRFNKNYEEWLVGQPGMLPLTANAPRAAAEPKGAPARAFASPSLAQVREYAAGRKSPVDADKFWHHYEATGWVSGRSKVTNWKSMLCFWERSDAAGTGKGGRAAVAGGPRKCPVCNGPELKKEEKFCAECARCRRCNAAEDLHLCPRQGGGFTVLCYKHVVK